MPFPTATTSGNNPTGGSPSGFLFEASDESPWVSHDGGKSQLPPAVPMIPAISDGRIDWVDTWVDVGMESRKNLGLGSIGGNITNGEPGVKGEELGMSSILPAQPRTDDIRPSSAPRNSQQILPHSRRLPDKNLNREIYNNSGSTNPYHRAKSVDETVPEIRKSQEDSSVDIWAQVAANNPPEHAPPPIPTDGVFDNLEDLSSQPSWRAGDLFIPRGEPSFAQDKNDNLISLEDTDQYQARGRLPPSLLARSETGLSSHESTEQKAWSEEDHHGPLRKTPITIKSSEVDSESRQTVESDPINRDGLNKNLPAVPLDNPDFAPELPPRPLQRQEDTPPRQPDRPPHLQISTPSPRSLPLRSGVETPQTKAAKQRSETYQIKHITWVDSSVPQRPRASPVMVQNANGPCPLLALVNALTLSTPANVNTALVETLRVREQISLGLLLDAVFDELMSGRRGGEAQKLPDVSELYSFLVTLHSGMNVNPQFITTNDAPLNLIDTDESDTSISQHRPGAFEETREMKLYSTFSIPLIHGWLPAKSDPAYIALKRVAQTYEDAQNLMFREEELEDKLQHQDLSPDEQQLFEDIATIGYFLSSSATQLTEHGLDTITKTLGSGDIAILFRNDHFSTLYKNPRSGQLLTLVTDMGYAGHDEVVWESLVDVNGEGCEFFAGDLRPIGNTANDTGTTAPSQTNDRGWSAATQTYQNRSNHQQSSISPNPSATLHPPNNTDTPISPTTEQEDHDLALAMQLQEEEEDRSRREADARRLEDQLSQAFLSSQQQEQRSPPNSRSSAPPAAQQRSSTTQRNSTNRPTQQSVRPLVPPRNVSTAPTSNEPARRPHQAPTNTAEIVRRVDPEAGDDAPPPSYEQAAKSQPYVPPLSIPTYSSSVGPVSAGPPLSTSSPIASASSRHHGARPRQASAYMQQQARGGLSHRVDNSTRMSASMGGLENAPGIARRRSAGVGGLDEAERRDKDCVVM